MLLPKLFARVTTVSVVVAGVLTACGSEPFMEPLQGQLRCLSDLSILLHQDSWFKRDHWDLKSDCHVVVSPE